MAEVQVSQPSSYCKDISGNRYGDLVVKGYSHSHKKRSYWVCQCDCGKTCVKTGNNIRSGHTLSCGCHLSKATVKRNTKHGLSKSTEYRTWKRMRERCLNKNRPDYHLYGGRGITVCEAWRDSFEQFFRDMGYRPSPHHSIDRIDNSKGYSPDNCRWATKSEQASNKRNTVLITCHGITKTLTAWVKETGYTAGTIKNRLKNGLSPELALSPGLKRARWRYDRPE
jgi:hypothetical protein